jgi:hypothetical protein
VAARPELDPRDRPEAPLSASRLEALGGCGLRYFYASVLRVRPPDDPAFDPERWLDAMRRGTLLHSVYDRMLDDAHRAGIDRTTPAFDALGTRILREEADAMRREVPAPSDNRLAPRDGRARGRGALVRRHDPRRRSRGGAHRAELRSARRRARRGRAHAAERSSALAARLDRPRGPAPVRCLRVVDYKTGVEPAVQPDPRVQGRAPPAARALRHGRRVAARRRGRVRRISLPDPQGTERAVAVPSLKLARGLEVLDRLLDIAPPAASSRPTTRRTASICDFKTICRVSRDRFGKLDSPPADWGSAHYGDEEYDLLRIVRGWS